MARSSLILTVVFLFVLFAGSNAFVNWAGTNLYYAAGLSKSQQTYLFSNLQTAGVKVIRVWLDGQPSNVKGTPITAYPSLEPYSVGQYDDTVLNLYDDVMITARSYGIKLLISMHSYNALEGGDVYGKWYGTGYFYESQDAINGFDNRLRHVLNHKHKTLGTQWKDLSEYIFAFEAQNEAMIGKGQQYIQSHQYWQCDRATTIRNTLGNSSILVTTGGESWLDESMQPQWWNCAALDIIAAHAYGPGDYDTNKIKGYVQKALQAKKYFIMEEWGACYFSTSNNDCPQGGVLSQSQRSNNIKNWANQIASAGIPWMYWQVLPNADPHYGYDYEIGINGTQWSTFVQVAKGTSNYNCAFDFSPFLYL